MLKIICYKIIHSLKSLKSMKLGYRDYIGIKKSEFDAKTQFLSFSHTLVTKFAHD